MVADLAVNYLERQVLLCGFTLERVRHDYGYDLIMATYDTTGQVEGGIVFFQVKATDKLPVLRDGEWISWPVHRRDLALWLKDTYPVILVVYDGERNIAHWLYIQAYFVEHSTAELFTAGETINVRIPIGNRINRRAIHRMRQYKESIRGQTFRRVDHHA